MYSTCQLKWNLTFLRTKSLLSTVVCKRTTTLYIFVWLNIVFVNVRRSMVSESDCYAIICNENWKWIICHLRIGSPPSTAHITLHLTGVVHTSFSHGRQLHWLCGYFRVLYPLSVKLGPFIIDFPIPWLMYLLMTCTFLVPAHNPGNSCQPSYNLSMAGVLFVT